MCNVQMMKSRTTKQTNSYFVSGQTSPSNGSYPTISPGYWLPAPNPTPYLIPDRKLFIGMLNKKYTEQDVRQLFSSHGTIDECTVLRDQNGLSRGCAFVTFGSKQGAISAIKILHQSVTMEGCSAPLVVKFADTQREKEQKKLNHIQASLMNTLITTNHTNGLSPNTTPQSNILGHQSSTTHLNQQQQQQQQHQQPVTQQQHQNGTTSNITQSIVSPVPLTITSNPPQQTNPFIASDAISPTSLQLLHQMQAAATVGFPQHHLLHGYTQYLNIQISKINKKLQNRLKIFEHRIIIIININIFILTKKKK